MFDAFKDDGKDTTGLSNIGNSPSTEEDPHSDDNMINIILRKLYTSIVSENSENFVDTLTDTERSWLINFY